MCGSDIFLCILAILFPPVAVWIKRGICSADSLLNVILFCLGYLPGLVHAWYIIFAYPDPYEPLNVDSEQEGGHHVTYYYVQQGSHSRSRQSGQGATHIHVFGPDQARSYGTLGGGGNEAATAPSAGQFPGQQTGTVNSFHPAPEQGKGSKQDQQQRSDAADGSSAAAGGEVPPSYSEAIVGDHKVQRQD